MALLPPDLGYELVNPPLDAGSGFSFGRGTRVHVAQSTISAPARKTDDHPLGRMDGITPGREYVQGRTITFDINIKTRTRDEVPSAKTIYRAMERSWLTEDTNVGATRREPGQVSELYITDGDQTLIAYGRPRNIESVRGRVRSGWIPISCDFSTITHKFYDYLWQQSRITTAPDTSTGFEFPFAFPLSTIAIGLTEDIVSVGGTTDTWMVSRIDGPITGPKIEVVGYYVIEMKSDFVLGPYDYVEIDPRPWARRISLNGSTNVAGKFTQASRRISTQTLPPGVHKVVLKGIDPTGTASLTTRWRDAYTSW